MDDITDYGISDSGAGSSWPLLQISTASCSSASTYFKHLSAFSIADAFPGTKSSTVLDTGAHIVAEWQYTYKPVVSFSWLVRI